MAVSLALIILLGLFADYLFKKIKLPGLLGILCVGIACGPYALNLIQPELLKVSADLRMVALIVILLRAGLELKRDTLNRVGKTALTMSCVPAIFEGAV
ncbi:MAG: cation:proton antiporter, partial [Nitrospinales bacterium]